MEALESKTPLEILKYFKEFLMTDKPIIKDGKVILFDVPVDAAKVKELLPPGLKLSDPPTATLFVGDFSNNDYAGPYKESAMLAHVESPLGKGVHCLWMIVSDDTAMMQGRELLGVPKKMGEFTFEVNGDEIRATVSRRGVKVLEVEGTRGSAQDPAPPVLGRKFYNSGGLGQFYLINPVWLTHPTETIHESYFADVTIKVNYSEHDPIEPLIDGDAASGRYAVMDWHGGKYHIPVGMAGVSYFGKTYSLRWK